MNLSEYSAVSIRFLDAKNIMNASIRQMTVYGNVAINNMFSGRKYAAIIMDAIAPGAIARAKNMMPKNTLAIMFGWPPKTL